jgi:DNA-binding transcriptional ArsR family regulator
MSALTQNNKKEGENKEVIENLLKDNSQGLTIQEISDKTGFHRQTVSVALAELKGENKIEIREVGQAKLHLLKDENSIKK